MFMISMSRKDPVTRRPSTSSVTGCALRSTSTSRKVSKRPPKPHVSVVDVIDVLFRRNDPLDHESRPNRFDERAVSPGSMCSADIKRCAGRAVPAPNELRERSFDTEARRDVIGRAKRQNGKRNRPPGQHDSCAPHGSVPACRDGEIDGVIERSHERRGIVDQVHDVVTKLLDLVAKIVGRETVARVLVVQQ